MKQQSEIKWRPGDDDISSESDEVDYDDLGLDFPSIEEEKDEPSAHGGAHGGAYGGAYGGTYAGGRSKFYHKYLKYKSKYLALKRRLRRS